MDRGVAMFDNQNYVGAADQLRQAAKSRALTDAERRRLQYLEAMCVFNEGRYAEAETLLRRWLADWGAAPERADVLMSVADCLFTSNYAEALKVYDEVDPAALANADRAEDLYYRTGFCCLKVALYDRADREFSRLENTSRYGDAARFYRAYICYARGDYEAAKAGFATVNTATPPGNMADYYLSQIYYKEGDYSHAISTATALLRRGDVAPEFVAEANRVAGESYYLTDRADLALPFLRKYVSMVDEPRLSSLYILGLSQYALGNYDEAAKTLRPVTADESSMGQNAYLYLGQALLKTGATSGAIMAFDRALNMAFDDEAREAAYYNYAVAKSAGGTVPFGSSVSTFEDFLTRYPNSRYADDVREYLVNGYLTDNNYEAALESLTRIPAPSPRILAAKQRVLYTLGARNLAAGNTAPAIRHLREAYGLRSHNAETGRETALALGEAYLKNSEFGQAVPLLEEYVRGKATVNTPIAWFDLGYAYLGEHKYEKGIDAFRHVIRDSKADATITADAWTRLGDCYYYTRNWSEAAAAYSKAYELQPSVGDYVLFQKSVMQGYAGNFNGKLEGLRRLLSEFPSSALVPDALLEMTEAQIQTGHPAEAVATWKRLIEDYPSTSQGRRAYLQLAVTMADKGRTAEAIDSYKALIARYPTSDEALQASEQLKRMCAANGTLDDYMAFIQGVENAPKLDAAEAERLAFEAAEEAYTNKDQTGLLEKFVKRYGDSSAYSLPAYTYLMDYADEHGNDGQAYRYATLIADRWPDNSSAELAYAIMGRVEYSRGNGEQALNSWQQLDRRASTPAMANEARKGIMRVARDLGRPDDLLRASESLLSSSTLGAEDKTEAAFSRGLAYQLKGNVRQAIADWTPLAKQSDNLYGAKAAVYLAEALLAQGDKTEAQNVAERFVNSGTPHSYWLARGFITLSDIYRARGKNYEAKEYLKALRENYPGTEPDIFIMIDERLAK